MVFGPKRLPEMMRSAGKAFRMFQTESQKAVAELREAVDTSDIQNDLRKIVMDEPDELARKAEERAAAAAAANAAAAAASTPPVLDPIPPHAAKKTAAKKTAAKKTAAAAPLAAQPPGGYPVTEDT